MEGHRGLCKKSGCEGKGQEQEIAGRRRGKARAGAGVARVQAGDQACRRWKLSREGPGAEQMCCPSLRAWHWRHRQPRAVPEPEQRPGGPCPGCPRTAKVRRDGLRGAVGRPGRLHPQQAGEPFSAAGRRFSRPRASGGRSEPWLVRQPGGPRAPLRCGAAGSREEAPAPPSAQQRVATGTRNGRRNPPLAPSTLQAVSPLRPPPGRGRGAGPGRYRLLRREEAGATDTAPGGRTEPRSVRQRARGAPVRRGCSARPGAEPGPPPSLSPQRIRRGGPLSGDVTAV